MDSIPGNIKYYIDKDYRQLRELTLLQKELIQAKFTIKGQNKGLRRYAKRVKGLRAKIKDLESALEQPDILGFSPAPAFDEVTVECKARDCPGKFAIPYMSGNKGRFQGQKVELECKICGFKDIYFPWGDPKPEGPKNEIIIEGRVEKEPVLGSRSWPES